MFLNSTIYFIANEVVAKLGYRLEKLDEATKNIRSRIFAAKSAGRRGKAGNCRLFEIKKIAGRLIFKTRVEHEWAVMPSYSGAPKCGPEYRRKWGQKLFGYRSPRIWKSRMRRSKGSPARRLPVVQAKNQAGDGNAQPCWTIKPTKRSNSIFERANNPARKKLEQRNDISTNKPFDGGSLPRHPDANRRDFPDQLIGLNRPRSYVRSLLC